MSTQKSKGTRAEVAVREYLNNNTDWEWFRPAPAGKNDKGDVQTPSLPSVVIEVKNCARLELAKWLDEAEQEAINANYAYVYAVWHKRKGKGNPGDWYVTMPGSVFSHLLNMAYG